MREENENKRKDAGAAPNNLVKGTILTLTGAACWGFSGCCGQYLFSVCGLKALWVVPYRLLISGLILMAVGFITNGKGNLRVFSNRKDMARMLLFGLCGVLMSQCSYFLAVQYANAATATVLQNLFPVMILVIVCIRGKRSPRGKEALAIGLAVVGVFLLGTHGNLTQLEMTPLGLFWGLMAAVAATLYTMLSGDLVRRYGTCQILGYGMVVSGIATCLILQPWRTPVIITLPIFLGLCGTILVGSAVAYGLYLKGVSIVGPVRGGLYGSMEPISAILISVVWLGVRFETMDYVGFVMTLAAVALLALDSGKS